MSSLRWWLAVGLITAGAAGEDRKGTRSHCLYSTLSPDAVVHAKGVNCKDIAAYCWSTIYGDDVRASCPQTCEECASILRQPGAQIEVGGVAFKLLPLGSEGEDAPANIGPADAAAAAGDATGGTPRTGGRSSSAFALVCLVTGAVVLVSVFALISWHARSKKNDFRYVQARLAQQMDQSTTDDFEWDGVLDDFMTVNTRRAAGGPRTSGLTERYRGQAQPSSEIDLHQLMRRMRTDGYKQRDPREQYNVPPQGRFHTTNDPGRRRPPDVPCRPSMRQIDQVMQNCEPSQDELNEAYEQPSQISTDLRSAPVVKAVAGQGGRKDGLVSGGGRRFPVQHKTEEPTYELAIAAPPLPVNYELCGSHVGSTSDSVAETMRSTESHGYDLCGSATTVEGEPDHNYELAQPVGESGVEYEIAGEGGVDYEIAGSSELYQNYEDGTGGDNAPGAVGALLAEPRPMSTTDSLGYEMCGSELEAQAKRGSSGRN